MLNRSRCSSLPPLLAYLPSPKSLIVQVEEGYEEGVIASPLASEATASLAGGSNADLPAMATGPAAAAAPAASAAANGVLTHRHSHHHRRLSASSSGHVRPASDGDLVAAVSAHTGRAARALRHRIRTAARRAPQYATEGVLALWASDGLHQICCRVSY